MATAKLTKKIIESLEFDPAGPPTQIVWEKGGRFGIRLTRAGGKLVTTRAWVKSQNRQYIVSLGAWENFGSLQEAREKAEAERSAMKGLRAGEEPAHVQARRAAAEAREPEPAAEPVAEGPAPLTFAKILDHYLEHFRTRIAIGEGKARTLSDYESQAERLTTHIGTRAVVGYTRREGRALYATLGAEAAAKGKGMVAANRLMSLAGAAVEQAISDELVDAAYSNPFTRWERAKERPRDNVLTERELGVLLSHVETLKDPILRNYFRLLASTGQRPGELGRILWDDVELDGEHPQFVIRCTKNHSDVTVGLTATEVTYFRELSAVRRVANPYVFPGRGRISKARRAAGVVPPPVMMPRPDRAWAQLRKVAGFPDLHLHDLKATAITNYARAGFTAEQLMDMGNHRQIGTTMRYVRLARDQETRDKMLAERERILIRARAAVRPADGKVTDLAGAREARAAAG